MAATHQRTFQARPGQVPRRWWLVDARDQVLGRLATRLARVLMGKHRPTYTPHVDTGDFVVVINAAHVRVTGRKLEHRTYRRFSGYPGGLREIPMGRMLQRHPERVITEAVRRMLPKNRLGRKMLKKLKVYAGPEHVHQAQKPEPLDPSRV